MEEANRRDAEQQRILDELADQHHDAAVVESLHTRFIENGGSDDEWNELLASLRDGSAPTP